jgi:predicted TIM-barrel fold metal-dependent hydrolase
VADFLSTLSETEREQILGTTATRFYGLAT